MTFFDQFHICNRYDVSAAKKSTTSRMFSLFFYSIFICNNRIWPKFPMNTFNMLSCIFFLFLSCLFVLTTFVKKPSRPYRLHHFGSLPLPLIKIKKNFPHAIPIQQCFGIGFLGFFHFIASITSARLVASFSEHFNLNLFV